MHTGHGGALKQGIQWLFGINIKGGSRELPHRFAPSQIQRINKCLHSWKTCVPTDFERKPRSLDCVGQWKMREMYVTGTRLIPALLVTEAVRATSDRHAKELSCRAGDMVDVSFSSMTSLQKEFFTNFMNLVVGLRIVSSNSMAPIAPVCNLISALMQCGCKNRRVAFLVFFFGRLVVHAAERPDGIFRQVVICLVFLEQEKLAIAERCFQSYVLFLERRLPEAVTLVVHLLLHLCDDAEKFGTHLGAISCYPFENFERKFGNVCKGSGGYVKARRWN